MITFMHDFTCDVAYCDFGKLWSFQWCCEVEVGKDNDYVPITRGINHTIHEEFDK